MRTGGATTGSNAQSKRTWALRLKWRRPAKYFRSPPGSWRRPRAVRQRLQPARAAQPLLHVVHHRRVPWIRREVARFGWILEFVVQLHAALALIPLRVTPGIGANAVAHESIGAAAALHLGQRG